MLAVFLVFICICTVLLYTISFVCVGGGGGESVHWCVLIPYISTRCQCLKSTAPPIYLPKFSCNNSRDITVHICDSKKNPLIEIIFTERINGVYWTGGDNFTFASFLWHVHIGTLSRDFLPSPPLPGCLIYMLKPFRKWLRFRGDIFVLKVKSFDSAVFLTPQSWTRRY